MPDYDFTSTLSPLDFEILSKDLLQEELGVSLELFSEGRDKGIDLRYAPAKDKTLIVQCKRYDPGAYALLKSKMVNKELPKIRKLNPSRYILATSVNLSVGQVDELVTLLSPYVKSSGDIYGRERLNSLLLNHPEIERRTLKLWISSTDVLEKLLNADLHAVSENEIARVMGAAKLYVKNDSFDEALKILKEHHVCIISGIPGIGKTTLARMLLLYFYNADFEIIKVESDIREASAAAYYKKPRFYYYDDFLGQTALPDKLTKNEDQKILDFIAAIRESKTSKLVLTTREYILNQARRTYEKMGRESFGHETYILDLAKYTRRNKAQMLYNHLYFSELPLDYWKAICAEKGYLKIVDHPNFNPRLIEFLTAKARTKDASPEDYLALCIAHLDDPHAIWKHAFEQQLSRAGANLLLILTTLPTEVASDDLNATFWVFHTAQAKKYTFATGPQDYTNALKELDGTFISTRRAKESVLVKFQNPSVRDFMQNYLLNSDSVSDLVGFCARFEQPQWFWATIADKESHLPRQLISQHSSRVRQALQQLFRAPSCQIDVVDFGSRLVVERRPKPNLPDRLAFVLEAMRDSKEGCDRQFVLSEITQMVDQFSAGEVSLAACLPFVELLSEIGLDSTTEVERFFDAIRSSCNKPPSTFDEFFSVSELVENHPIFLAPEQVQKLSKQYAVYSTEYAAEIARGAFDELNDPDDIRVIADRIKEVGSTFSVDTTKACATVKEYALEQEIEQDMNRDWDDDNRGGGGNGNDQCSDSELDSMFSTLNGE
jgi:hypothetical protein